MIEGFDYQEQYLGTDDTTDYSFQFFIYEASQLRIYIQDHLGNILNDTTGDDATVVASLIFDTENGGGTLSLVASLPNQYVLTMFLANDQPDQPTDFPNKQSFTLDAIEGALDYIAAWGQRIAFLAQRALRLHDLDDISAFDMRLPLNLSTYPKCVLQVNMAGDGWEMGPTIASLLAQIVAAEAATAASEATAAAAAIGATAAETEALTSAASATGSATAAAASAAIAASFASGIVHTGPFAAIAPNASANLLGEVIDSTKFTMVEYTARIQRGTTVYAKQLFTIFFRSGAWELALGQDLYADAGSDHGVTFAVDSGTAQISATVANDGGSNAVIDLDKIQWPI